MSWIIRLQNLPWSANSMDIRMFFSGLSIPDGGVHIVGGEKGDAFIAFSTDEDARQAMTLDGCKLKEVGVRLLLSSRAEMQKVIETARQQTVSVFQLAAPTPPVQIPPQPIIQTQQAQLLLAQQLLQQQQQQVHQQAQQHHLPPYNSAVAAIPGLGLGPKVDFPPQAIVAPQIVVDRNRHSVDKRLASTGGGGGGGRDRWRDSRSRSRERDRRGRSRSRDRSNSRDRGRRNRSRSRSRDRSYRRRREKRSYSRDEYDSDDSDSRGSSGGGRKRSPPNKSNVQVWDNQAADHFRATVYSNGAAGTTENGNSHNATAFQQLRERRNESAAPKKAPTDKQTAANDGAIDLTEDDRNCCVKVSNIERTTGYGELRRFFQGLPVCQNGLKMINDNQGKRTGVAYVRFHRPESRKFAIMRSGQTLNGNKLVVHTLDDNEFDLAVDSYRPPIGSVGQQQQQQQQQQLKKTQNGDGASATQGSGGGPPPLAFEHLVFTCLKVTDVPSLTTEQDIMKVFSDYGLAHIIIAKDKQKRHCAFIKLNRAEEAKRALQEKNSFTMAHKVVTVTMCSEAVFEDVLNSTAIEQQEDAISSGGGGGAKDSDDRVASAGGPTPGEDSGARAVRQKGDKPKSGSRWGEKVVVTPVLENLLPNRVPDMSAELAAKKLPSTWGSIEEQRKPEVQAPHPLLSQLNLALPLLSTLLPQAAAAVRNVEQQQQQLQQLPVAPVSRDPRLKNMSANNVAANALPRGAARNDPRLANNANRFAQAATRAEETDCVVISNLEPTCSDLDVAAFFSKAGIVPQRVHILLSTTGEPSGDAFVEFSCFKDANLALLQNERLLGKNPVFVETISRQQVDEVLASFGPTGNRTMGPINPQPPPSIYNQFAATGIHPGLLRGLNPRMALQRPPFTSGNGDLNAGMQPTAGESNVLALNNVPYRAGVEDIIDFFDGFDVRPQDIMRRFNDNGQPTAEAKVRFKNPAEARKAFEQKKFGKISGRTIFLEFDH